MGRTIVQWTEYFDNLYGDRNRIFLPDPEKQLLFILSSVRTLTNVWRKNQTEENFGMALARIAARTFVFAALRGPYFAPIFVGKMAEKYPAYGCAYCGRMPCKCDERRPDPTIRENSRSFEQIPWALEKWQQHTLAVYGEKNAKVPLSQLLNHLSTEVSEVGELLLRVNQFPNTETAFRELARELSDVLSRTLTLAGLVGVNLEPVLEVRYAKCPKCGNNPCMCGPFAFSQINVVTGERE